MHFDKCASTTLLYGLYLTITERSDAAQRNHLSPEIMADVYKSSIHFGNCIGMLKMMQVALALLICLPAMVMSNTAAAHFTYPAGCTARVNCMCVAAVI